MSMQELRDRIKAAGLDNADYIGEENPACPSCKTPFEEHLGLVGTCRQLQEVTAELHNVYRKLDSDKYLLRGALRIIREARLNVGSTELFAAAKKEGPKLVLEEIETAVGIRRCRYCEGHPVMHLMAERVYECPECAYEETT